MTNDTPLRPLDQLLIAVCITAGVIAPFLVAAMFIGVDRQAVGVEARNLHISMVTLDRGRIGQDVWWEDRLWWTNPKQGNRYAVVSY